MIDIGKIPATLQAVPWIEMEPGKEWTDGDVILAVVEVNCSDGEYDLAVVRIAISEEMDGVVSFSTEVDGNDWGWTIDSVLCYVYL